MMEGEMDEGWWVRWVREGERWVREGEMGEGRRDG